LDALITSTELDPQALQHFVNTYIKDYKKHFTRPNISQRKALFKKASEHFIKLYHAQLENASSLEKVNTLMENFTQFFP
ncbi:MAG TPA: hypothetical protein PLD88_14650, partial [Candidatus Berkiella sp.]|nr:hypothetical protein [Candidatus Berkiella sp.]